MREMDIYIYIYRERERERSSYLVRKLALTRNLVKARLVLAGGWVSALRISFGREKTMKSTYLCFIFVSLSSFSPTFPLRPFPPFVYPASRSFCLSLSLFFKPLPFHRPSCALSTTRLQRKIRLCGRNILVLRGREPRGGGSHRDK